jgi:hypothetical protein
MSGYESTIVWQVNHHLALMCALQQLNSIYGKGDIRKHDAARQKVFIVPYGMSGKWYQYRLRVNKDGSSSIKLHNHRRRV